MQKSFLNFKSKNRSFIFSNKIPIPQPSLQNFCFARHYMEGGLNKANPIYHVNGEFVRAEKAVLPVRDLAILRGYACFDYFRTYNGKPFSIARNVGRLRNSCNLIQLDFPWTDQQISEIILETLRRNQESPTDDWGIRVVVSGGISDNNIIPTSNPSLIVIVEKPPVVPPQHYANGIKVITVDINRIFPNAKTTNYITAVVSQKKALQENAVEAIYVKNGYVQEGTTTNIFAFYADKLVTTPTDNVLPGVTRGLVLEIAANSFEVKIEEYLYETLLKADEAFITSATKRIVPVVNIDGHTIGSGKVGKNTQSLIRSFEELCNREIN